MFTIRTGKLVAVAFVALLGAGCSREQQDWRTAEATDTIEAYDQFIQHHPDSELVTEARSRVVQLGEERDWHEAGTVDTADAYRQFLTQHPNGKWAQEARIRIESFALAGPGTNTSASSPAQVPGAGTATTEGASVPAAASRPRTGTGGQAVRRAPASPALASVSSPRSNATAPLASAGGAGVQLGAFNTEEGARKEWQILESRFAPQLKGLGPRIATADTPSGRVYRLQAVVSDEARARALCEALKKRGQGCMTVQLR